LVRQFSQHPLGRLLLLLADSNLSSAAAKRCSKLETSALRTAALCRSLLSSWRTALKSGFESGAALEKSTAAGSEKVGIPGICSAAIDLRREFSATERSSRSRSTSNSKSSSTSSYLMQAPEKSQL
jgi:hypothetical protein